MSAAGRPTTVASSRSTTTAYDGKVAGLYDLGDTLGRGHFAVVKLARHVFTGEKVAVKVIDKTKLDEVSRAHLFQEVRCMKLVQHPNVVRLYEVIDTQTKLYLILELGDGGDMYDYIMRHEKGLDEEAARKYFAQIVHAISYCHRLHVVHRDLKPENVVFFEKLGMVKLTDFGFSNRFCPGQKLETSCGSLAYSAPEILLGDSYDAPAVDVWSLGVILYMLVGGHAPFQEANDSETLTMIMDCKYTIPLHVSSDCSRLIQRMLIRDPEKRATLEEITSDPWLESVSNVQHADYLPLISREHLSDDDHSHILQKMAIGNIATQEEIVGALDKNAYNHITATYFLLAERKLRALRQEQAKLLNTSQVSDLAALAISPRNPSIPCPGPLKVNLLRNVESLLSPQEARRTIESQVATCALDLPPTCHYQTRSSNRPGLCSPPFPVRDGILKTRLAKPSTTATKSEIGPAFTEETSKIKCTNLKTESASVKPPSEIDQQIKTTSDDMNSSKNTVSNTISSVRASLQSQFATNKFKPVTAPSNRKLHSVRSSPQLTLNEIYEEVESDCEVIVQSSFVPLHANASPTTRVLQSQQSMASPGVLRKYDHQRRFAKARTASCSSSDASDDDTDTRKRKAEKLKQIPGWRRGNWEDDSDPSNGPGGSGSGAASGNINGGGGDTGSNGDDRSAPSEDPPSSPNEKQSSSPERQRPADDISGSVQNSKKVIFNGRCKELRSKQSRSSFRVELSKHVHSWPSQSPTSSPSKPSRSPASIVYGTADDTASPPPSPLSTPNITSLRQSKTLNQLNRYVTPPISLIESNGTLSDVNNKENRDVPRVNSPLRFLNLKRGSRYQLPSSTTATAMRPAGSEFETNLAPSTSYKHGLYRLLKHTPHLGGSKRWDINRNGLSSPEALVVGSPPPSSAPQYGIGQFRMSSGGSSASSSSHSKCCSLC